MSGFSLWNWEPPPVTVVSSTSGSGWDTGADPELFMKGLAMPGAVVQRSEAESRFEGVSV